WAPLRPRPWRLLHEVQGWGIFDRYNGEFSTGIDKTFNLAVEVDVPFVARDGGSPEGVFLGK
ncbi:MAG: hypothetical protein DMG35_15750, partial [Acidobacteria bacterium]